MKISYGNLWNIWCTHHMHRSTLALDLCNWWKHNLSNCLQFSVNLWNHTSSFSDLELFVIISVWWHSKNRNAESCKFSLKMANHGWVLESFNVHQNPFFHQTIHKKVIYPQWSRENCDDKLKGIKSYEL